MSRRTCPRCGGTTDLIHRRRLDRIVSAIREVRRYQCRNPACRWEGLLPSHARGDARHRPMTAWMWALVLVVSIAVAIALIGYLNAGRVPADAIDPALSP